jgi:hypothetical protein
MKTNKKYRFPHDAPLPQVDSKEAELTAAQERVLELEEAARNLLDQLNKVTSSREYVSVWAIYQIHGGKYTGPQYGEELKKLSALLKGGE